jgi:hypothetical protein
MHQCHRQGKTSQYEVCDNIDDVNDLVHWEWRNLDFFTDLI